MEAGQNNKYDIAKTSGLTNRAVARSENPGGPVVLWWALSAPLVEIGLTFWPKTGGEAKAPPAPLRQP